MTKEQAESLLDLVIDRAPKLRSAGVLELHVDSVVMKLAPAVPDQVEVTQTDEGESDPWNDPVTFGRTASVPGKDSRREPTPSKEPRRKER